MSTYTPGDHEDHVIRTDIMDHDLDLTLYIQRFKTIKSGLQVIPREKTTPDQETLDHWNSTVYVDGQDAKERLDEDAVNLYNDLKPIKDAGLLPLKYDDEYQQLENYINSLP